MIRLIRMKITKKLSSILLCLALVVMCIPSYAPSVSAAEDNIPIATDAVIITAVTSEEGFTHPGVGLTKEILENMREQVIAKKDPWYSYYREMALTGDASRTITSSNASSSDPTKPANTAMNSKGAFVADGLKAFTQAVMYYITGDEVYRANAMRIIRIWSQMDPTRYTYFTDSHIHMGIPLHRMVVAAEILRYSNTTDGDPNLVWTDKDTEDFTNNLITPTIETFLDDNNYFMNQHTYPLLGAVSGYIFTNDLAGYEKGVEWFTVNETAIDQGKNGSIQRLFRLVDHDALTGEPLDPPRVQHVEMGRDQAHGAGDLINAEILSRLLEAQGTTVDPVTGTVSTEADAVGVYQFLNNRMLDAADYFARFMLGYDTPWTPTAAHMDPDGNPTIIYKALSQEYRGRIGGNVYGLYYYYKYELGLDLETVAPYYTEMFNKRTPFYWESPDAGAEYWLYIPKEAEVEGSSTLPKFSANPDLNELEYRTTLLDEHSTIVEDEDTSYVSMNATEEGSRIAIVASSTSAKTIALKVRTNGTARLEINGWSDEPIVIPDTGGEWKYVNYTLGHLRGLGDLIYLKAFGDGTVIDIDHINLVASAQLTPPVFKLGTTPLHLFTYVGSSTQVQYDFSALDSNASDIVTYQISNMPEGAVFNSETGAFSWKPEATGVYSFVVSASDGQSISAREVNISVGSDRHAAVTSVVEPYSESISYVSSSLKHYQSLYNEVLSITVDASDEVFLAKLIELRSAVESLELLTPLLKDGSINYNKLLHAATFYNEIPNLLDEYPGSFAYFGNAVNLTHTIDFGPDFKVRPDAFSLQVRASFPERVGSTTIFASNDKENWVRITPGITEVSEDMQTLEVSSEYKDQAFRFFNIQMIDTSHVTTANAMLELSELRIFGERVETNNKLKSVILSSPQSMQGRVDLGDSVLLSFQATEQIENVEVVIQGQQADVYSADGINWIASTTMTADTPTGKINFEITYTTEDGLISDPVIFPSNNSQLYYVNKSNKLNVPKMATVVASSIGYGNNGLPKEQVGYLLFDEQASTFGDLADGTGAYYDIDFGAEAKVKLSDVLMLPRTGHSARLNGTLVQGSDDGEEWTDLTKAVSGAADNTWSYLGLSNESNSFYRYIRIYNRNAWSGNIAEVELFGEFAVQSIDSHVLDQEGYTRLSYYWYMQEVERIRAAIGQPGADGLALLEQLWDAENLLQKPADTKVSIVQDQVKASIKAWGVSGDNYDEQLRKQNGWRAFDGDINTATDANSSRAWIDVDFGEGNEKVLTSFRFHPRHPNTNHIGRMNGAIIQGSVDGETYVDLHTISGVTSAKWYEVVISNDTPFRYLRYHSENGSANVAELEFFEKRVDTSLMSYWIDIVETLETELYTEESVLVLTQAYDEAVEILNSADADQALVDAAADRLQGAIADLTYSPDVPVLEPLAAVTAYVESEITFTIATVNSVEGTTYSATTLPEGATFDSETGVFTWTPEREQSGNYTIVVTASANGYATSQTLNVKVKGYPELTTDMIPSEWTARNTLSFQVVATDHSGEALTYSIHGLPPGHSLNPYTGVFVWTPGQADYGSYTVEISVSNGAFTTTHTVNLNIELDTLEAIPYTKASYYIYSNELSRIRTAMEQPGANKAKLAAELDKAEAELISTDTLQAERIEVMQEQVTASTVHYDDRASAATPELLNKNGWQALDGQLSTFTDTTASNGWIEIDFGEGNAISLGSFRFYPRSTHVTRVNGAILQGSNDGTSFVDLYIINGITSAQWYKAPIHDQDSYRYLRYYSPNGNTNIAELEFYEKALDSTLLQLLVNEVNELDTELYTEATVAVVLEKKASAELLIQNGATQAQIDAASDELIGAMDQLALIPINITATSITSSSLVLNWSNSLEPEQVEQYEIYMNDEKLDTVTDTTYNVEGLQPETAYDFKIVAYYMDESVVESKKVTIRTVREGTIFMNLNATSITPTSLVLNWSEMLEPVVEYEIYMDEIKLGTVPGATYSYTVTGLQAGTDYSFKVVAIHEGELTTESESFTVKTARQQSSGNDDGGYTPPVNDGVETDDQSVNGASIEINATVKDGVVQETISSTSMSTAIANATQSTDKALTVEMISNEEYSAFSIELPLDGWKQAIEQGITSILVKSDLVSVQIPTSVLAEAAANGQVKLSIGRKSVNELPPSIAGQLENKPVMEFSLDLNGQAITDFSDEPIKVSIPYTSSSDEQAESLVAVYIHDNGEIEIIRGSKYNEQSGLLVFDALHFSTYAVLSNTITFSDMDRYSWAQRSVNALAARQIVNGIGNDRFAPERTVTRAEFLKMMMEAFDLVQQGKAASFTDVKEGKWYYDSIATAQALNIINGYEDGSFGVNQAINREEMAVIAVRIVEAAGLELTPVRAGAAFDDAEQIAGYAEEAVKALNAAGYIEGQGNGRFAPKSQMTRAEAAVLIARILGLN